MDSENQKSKSKHTHTHTKCSPKRPNELGFAELKSTELALQVSPIHTHIYIYIRREARFTYTNTGREGKEIPAIGSEKGRTESVSDSVDARRDPID